MKFEKILDENIKVTTVCGLETLCERKKLVNPEKLYL